MAFIDFKAVSSAVPFREVLNRLNVTFEEFNDGLKGKLHDEHFIVTPSKNLFLCPHKSDWKGSIINFWSIHASVSLVDAAKAIQREFIDPPKERKREIPDLKLEYCAWLRKNQVSPETSDELEAGLCKQKATVAGKVCFKVYNADGSEIVGYNFYDKEGNPCYPNGYKHDHIFNLHRVKTDWAIVAKSPLEACQLHTSGYKNVIGLTRESLTDEQATHLSQFKRLVFYGCSPHAVMRMASHCDVRIADDEYLGKL